MIRLLAIYLIMILGLPCTGQEVIQLDLNQRITDDQFIKTQAIMPVFWYTGLPFEGHKNFGIKPSKKIEEEQFSIRFPEMHSIQDTSYMYLFFGEAPKTPRGYVFCVLGKNQLTEPYTLLWIDRNQNLDLTDDGPPDTFYNIANFYLDISIPNPQYPQAFHLVRISRFKPEKNQEYRKLADQHIQKNSGNRAFSGTYLSFREQRLNIKSTQYKSTTDSFRISIKDHNANGLYNDSDQDQIIINQYNTEEAGSLTFTIQSKQTHFEWNQKTYEVLKIEPSGAYIQFIHRPNQAAQRQLRKYKKIPRFTYHPAEPDAKPRNIRKHKGKPLFIYLFDPGNPQTHQDTLALGKLHRNHKEEIQILMLNYGESLRKAIGWKHSNKSALTLGIIDQKTAQKLHIYNLPTTIFLCKKQRICEINLNSQQILEYFEQKQQQQQPN